MIYCLSGHGISGVEEQASKRYWKSLAGAASAHRKEVSLHSHNPKLRRFPSDVLLCRGRYGHPKVCIMNNRMATYLCTLYTGGLRAALCLMDILMVHG